MTIMSLTTKRTPLELSFLAKTRLSSQRERINTALYPVRGVNEPFDCHLAIAVRTLAIFADTGEGPGLDEIQDIIADIISLLYINPSMTVLDCESFSDSGFDPIGQSIDAAHARIRIALGEPVPLRLLSALSDLSLISIRKLCVRGALAISERGCATAESAAHWLGKRGVIGYPRPLTKGGANAAE